MVPGERARDEPSVCAFHGGISTSETRLARWKRQRAGLRISLMHPRGGRDEGEIRRIRAKSSRECVRPFEDGRAGLSGITTILAQETDRGAFR